MFNTYASGLIVRAKFIKFFRHPNQIKISCYVNQRRAVYNTKQLNSKSCLKHQINFWVNIIE